VAGIQTPATLTGGQGVDHFSYRNGRLWCDQVAVTTVAEDLGTPAYIYSAATLRHHYHNIAQAFAALDPSICYALKSCQNLSICRLLREQGAGFDVVSGGELYRALQAGADPQKMVFAGVGKTDREINEAIDAGLGWFNVESEEEMETLTGIAG